ncbi:MAG TPA: response regulator, partial [Gemmataceae bacterium]|nr:response regulator [Gemmataceae bacterium]
MDTTPHKRILLIDDNPATREATSMILAATGYCVALAGNGADALLRLREHRPPDLILLDLAMPVVDGRQFRREQQKDPALAAIPIVVFSAAEQAPEEAAALGACGCLVKPVDPSRLLQVVRECCA